MTMTTAELLRPPVEVKWITDTKQGADHQQQTLLTREHDVITEWARVRCAEPATGKGKLDVNDGGTGLRFDFPGMGRLEPISWDQWFREFDEYDLVFVFRSHAADGQTTYDYRLVTRAELDALGVKSA